MVRRVVILITLIVSFCNLTKAQGYGNEWIDYSNDRYYAKFPISENGVHRIDYNTLSFVFQLMGTDITNIDPRTVQIFGRNAEQHIYIEGETDGQFNPGDFIEFYAEKNDGWYDEQMYTNSQGHTNPFYSLVNDEIHYFISWEPNGAHSSKRLDFEAYGTPPSNPVNFLIQTERRVYTNSYSQGDSIFYSAGKGFMSSHFGYNAISEIPGRRFAPDFSKLYTGNDASPVDFSAGIGSHNNGANGLNAHHVRIRYENGSGSQLLEDLIEPRFFYTQKAYQIPVQNLDTESDFIIETPQNGALVNATADYNKAAYMQVKFPRTTEFNQESSLKLEVPASAFDLFLNATNWSTNATPIVYDLENNTRIETEHNSSTGALKASIKAGNQRPIFISTSSAILNLTSQDFKLVSEDGQFDSPLLSLDSVYLIITNRALEAGVSAYESYRAQDYNTAVFYIDELCDQFGAGIERHPQSIRGFLDYALNEWPSAPSHLFLIGKSIAENVYRDINRNNPNVAASVLVPTMANPPSDNLLSAGLVGNKKHVAAIPTGRITAQTNADVNLYLDKIRRQEIEINDQSGAYTIKNKLWQKRILHFAGGDNSAENRSLRAYLDQFAAYAEDSLMGAQRILFSKTSGNVIQQLDVDSVRDLIREGVAIMNFFSHSSGNNFDISVDNPDEWGNESQGRYPVVIANSCYSGDIHRAISNPSISEDYVFTPNEGAIGFIATPYLSQANLLRDYTSRLYQQMCRLSYGKTIGENMRLAADMIGENSSTVGVALEMTLHGDPALKVFPHKNTEITINDPELGPAIRLEPSIITSNVDSFDVHVTLTNLGKSTNRPFTVTARRTFEANTQQEEYFKIIDGINFQKEVVFRIPVSAEYGLGRNFISIEVDLPNSIVSEFNEFTNNEIDRFSFEVSSTDIFPVYPYDFAVVSDIDVTLKANTGLPNLATNEYLIQIDTTDLFNSPLMMDTIIEQSGAVVNWRPRLSRFGLEDSTVFFWRVAPSDELDKWRMFSFQVINGKTGWGQDHFYQMENNNFDFLSYNRQNRRIRFDSVSRDLFVNALAVPPSFTDYEFLSNHRYTLDGQGAPLGENGVAPGGFPSLIIAVIDSTDLKPWGTYGVQNGLLINEGNQFGNTNNYNTSTSRGRRVEYWFSFRINSPSGLDNAINLIENEAENGHYILVYTSVRGLFQDSTYWKDEHFEAFENLGADSIRFVENDHPYIFLAKKGAPQTAIEVIGKNNQDAIQLNAKVKSNIQRGEIIGPEIGPALEWGNLYFKAKALESNSFDEASVSAKNLSQSSYLIGPNTQYESDLSIINADSNASIILEYSTKDSVGFTPAQLDNWHVLYQPAPEAAINPQKGISVPPQQVSVGENISFGVAIENISEFTFRYLRVKYWLVNENNELVDQRWLNYDSVTAGEVIFDSISYATSDFTGTYLLSMEVNPIDEEWQKEKYHFNNTFYSSFTVEADKQNPLLEVTFDGIHIINGDIVSPSPSIVMQVKDENPLLLMDDTTTFDVFLTGPNGNQRRIPFIQGGTEVMQFEPASNQKNKARLSYSPEELGNGEYKLIVQARDASGNSSGRSNYEVEFEVINESTVTHVTNFPNPFTTSTRFVFTLTGQEIPDIFTIQIMTVTGKVVREITIDELGPINIGRNITDYAWDGRDEYGDRLANGVYLYRVNMKINGEVIERRGTELDQYFTEEFGKMYLFR